MASPRCASCSDRPIDDNLWGCAPPGAHTQKKILFKHIVVATSLSGRLWIFLLLIIV